MAEPKLFQVFGKKFDSMLHKEFHRVGMIPVMMGYGSASVLLTLAGPSVLVVAPKAMHCHLQANIDASNIYTPGRVRKQGFGHFKMVLTLYTRFQGGTCHTLWRKIR